MNEEQIIDFLITQSEILGLEKENCPYYQIMKFIRDDKEKICQLNKNCIEDEILIQNQKKELEEVKAEKEKYERIVKRALMYLDYIDDDTLKMCTSYDVNGIDILKILKGD